MRIFSAVGTLFYGRHKGGHYTRMSKAVFISGLCEKRIVLGTLIWVGEEEWGGGSKGLVVTVWELAAFNPYRSNLYNGYPDTAETSRCRVRPLWPSASTLRIVCAADGHKGRTLHRDVPCLVVKRIPICRGMIYHARHWQQFRVSGMINHAPTISLSLASNVPRPAIKHIPTCGGMISLSLASNVPCPVVKHIATCGGMIYHARHWQHCGVSGMINHAPTISLSLASNELCTSAT